MKFATKLLLSAVAGLGLAYNAAATDIPTDIDTDTVYTAADNPLFLKGPTFVNSGASLTFGPGCIVITLTQDDGGIVVTRGSQLFVNGTEAAPVIMTSGADVATWPGSVVTTTGADLNNDGDTLDTVGGVVEATAGVSAVTSLGTPTSGTLRQRHQEWRNITILGNGVISASEFDGLAVNDPDDLLPNPTVVDGTASKNMEGLETTDLPAGLPDSDIAYGGGDDDDDSGSISFLSMRYTGRVLGEGNELNGLSLGGIGRGTDISHVDIMNNVDDGIEIWGGTVNIKYFSVWNVGDDSFDVDQGWRGKAQFGLIVQGFADGESALAVEDAEKVQGSGVGDNIFETDGAEQADVQPRTTAVIYNVTAIGMTNGDGATTWRDNARVQYRNMLFCDIGEELVRFDNVDGDGGTGYATGGTHSWVSIWSTPASTLPTAGADNPGAGSFAPAVLYTTQVDGNLAEITDSLIFDGTTGATGASGGDLGDGGDNAFLLGVLGGATGAPLSSVATNNVYTSTCPIQVYDRSGATFEDTDFTPSKIYTLVSSLDPRPTASAAYASVFTAPADGFFAPARFRGGFSPDNNWAEGWTAASQFGLFANTGNNPADPAIGSITLAAKLNFPTTDGVFYTVYESADGVAFTPMATIEGDGTTMSVADLDDFDASKLYKVEAQ
ncbi:MAG: hypothetical protein KTR15_15845 [Phycisphaeraceae bacterium]|nr:hypothetical protein [Phycisphaeraceae bacterium]